MITQDHQKIILDHSRVLLVLDQHKKVYGVEEVTAHERVEFICAT